MNRLAMRIRDDALAVVDIPPHARRAFAEEAAFRRRSVGAMVEDLLEAIAADDLFAELLDGKGRR